MVMEMDYEVVGVITRKFIVCLGRSETFRRPQTVDSGDAVGSYRLKYTLVS
jgi:hypothetical protein